MSSILKIIAGDNNLIPYRKELRALGKTVTGTILLQQFIYWDDKMDGGDFYKYITPPSDADTNKFYRAGDSWTEELGFSKKEFSSAYKILEEQGFVSKKIDANRVTTWHVNTETINIKILELYQNLQAQKPTNSAKSPKVTYLSDQRELSAKLPKGTYVSDQRELTSITENTTKNTQREEPHAQNFEFPFFVEEFGDDEQSNHIGRPSLNQVLHEAKHRLKFDDLEVAKAFWLSKEANGWRGIIDWIPALRKWEMSWKNNQRTNNQNNNTEFKKPAPRIEHRPKTIEELKRWLQQDDNYKRINIKSPTGVYVISDENGRLMDDISNYHLEESTANKYYNFILTVDKIFEGIK